MSLSSAIFIVGGKSDHQSNHLSHEQQMLWRTLADRETESLHPDYLSNAGNCFCVYRMSTCNDIMGNASQVSVLRNVTEIYGKIKGEVWINSSVFTVHIKIMIMH